MSISGNYNNTSNGGYVSEQVHENTEEDHGLFAKVPNEMICFIASKCTDLEEIQSMRAFKCTCKLVNLLLSDTSNIKYMIKLDYRSFAFATPEQKQQAELVAAVFEASHTKNTQNMLLYDVPFFKSDMESWMISDAHQKLMEEKKPREIILEAVRNNPIALQYAAPALLNDNEIVLAALRAGRAGLPDQNQ